LLAKFYVLENLKFTGLGNISSDLRNSINIMSLKGLDKSFFPKIFPLTLGETVSSWFHSLGPHKVNTWECSTKEFLL